MQHKKHTVIIGVGNPMRSDDGVGVYVSELIRKRIAEEPYIRSNEEDAGGGWNITITEASGEGASLMELWQDAEKAIIIDAVSSHKCDDSPPHPPGTIYQFNASVHEIPARFFHYSTHQFSVAEAVEMARILKKLPEKLLVFGIEGQDFQYGEQLSEPVKKAAHTVAEEILCSIKNKK